MNRYSDHLGDLPPITAKGARKPDRRRVSFRWLTSTFLVGMTSVFLMGGALFVALDGRQELTIPAIPAQERQISGLAGQEAFRGDRLVPLTAEKTEEPSDVMMVSTVTRQGDQDIVKMRPFKHVNAPLAIATNTELNYPPFDPLTAFAESKDLVLISKSSDVIYGAQVESEVALKSYDFDPAEVTLASTPRQMAADIEDMVRRNLTDLSPGATNFSSIAWFDSARFEQDDSLPAQNPGILIVPENVSTLAKVDPQSLPGTHFMDRRVPIRSEAPISIILQTEGIAETESNLVEEVLSADLGARSLQEKDLIHATYEVEREGEEERMRRIARLSVFRGPSHVVSIARTDDGRFVYAQPPEDVEPDENRKPRRVVQPVLPRSKLPSTYDGIFRAALAEGLPNDLANILVRIFAFDVDFRSKVSPNDKLDVFLSLEDGETAPTANSEILYASITTGGVERKYYRFRDSETGRIDYYDETGKSAKKFLLRQPVPNGKFRSPFGWRTHPILRYKKMHWGVDWAAPHGTKILAAGNGVIESAGWAGGNGRRIKINHANGYQTSYSHLRAFAKGIKAGTRVRQGQLIGYVGSSGLSTGPHLHYEVSVNGTRVNPMKIRLPQGKVLQGAELAQFEAERDRIDALLEKRGKRIDLALNES